MSTYVQLDCLDCEHSLSFGKPIASNGRLLLRLYSEMDGEWHEGERCWVAVQAYLFRHMGHRLVFREDNTPDAQAFGEVVDMDQLARRV